MIAEKTADAIRGRKLAPFEPPTRIAAGVYGQHRPNHMPLHPAASSHESVVYKALYPGPGAQLVAEPAPTYMSAHPRHRRPRAGDFMPRAALQEAAASPPLNLTGGELAADSPLELEAANYLEESALDERAHSEQSQRRQQWEAEPTSEQRRLQTQHNQFLQDRYAKSTMASNLIKQVAR